MSNGVELSIIIPVLNEAGSYPSFLVSLFGEFRDTDFEVIIVDGGSTDGTAEKITTWWLSYSAEHDLFPERLRVQIYPSASLLASVAQGMRFGAGRLILVMDGDGQHSPGDAHSLFLRIKELRCDLVVGSRALTEGQVSTEVISKFRQRLSRLSNCFNRVAFGIPLSDPLSGFFVIKAKLLDPNRYLKSDGFKILFEILMHNKNIRMHEFLINFSPREYGKSKFDIRNSIFFVASVISHISGSLVSSRFIVFCLIGLFVLGFHIATFSLLSLLCDFLSGSVRHASALFVSSFLSYFLNRLLTFGDLERRFGIKASVTLFVLLSLALSLPNYLIFEAIFERLNFLPMLYVSLVSIPADTFMKYWLVRRVVWK